jgi:3-dehydroquinate synthase
MPSFRVETPHGCYAAVVERGAMGQLRSLLPPDRDVFVISTEDVWRHQGKAIGPGWEPVFLPGGEESKRLSPLEAAAEELVRRGADRASVIVGFGGGIVTDMAGFLAAIFMRGIPVIQVPTTLLAQVDAGVGGKTGVNLESGKNLIGSFHQPFFVLIDPAALDTLPEREYRAGLQEIVKCGVIRDPDLFRVLAERSEDVLGRKPEALDRIIADSVRIKAEVVSADERESGLRRILNFGHTFGHALEAETGYSRFLHGEAVGFGMCAAAHLAVTLGKLTLREAGIITETVRRYGPFPSFEGIRAENLLARLVHDKKTVRGRVHFVLPVRIGEVEVVSGVDEGAVLDSIQSVLS